MSILKELTTYEYLLEAPSVAIDIKKLFNDVPPKTSAAALEKLWGSQHLSWHGKRFFDEGDAGPAYVQAEEAARKYLADGDLDDIIGDVTVDLSPIKDELADDVDYQYEYEFNAVFENDESTLQESYLGYDPKRDVLYIGFDAWSIDEDFNNGWDAKFEEASGIEFDNDNPLHEKILDTAWKMYHTKQMGYYGLVFEITDTSGSMKAEMAHPPMTGGFYGGMYKMFKSENPNVIDLRLD
jgi:hypothetical protein